MSRENVNESLSPRGKRRREAPRVGAVLVTLKLVVDEFVTRIASPAETILHSHEIIDSNCFLIALESVGDVISVSWHFMSASRAWLILITLKCICVYCDVCLPWSVDKMCSSKIATQVDGSPTEEIINRTFMRTHSRATQTIKILFHCMSDKTPTEIFLLIKLLERKNVSSVHDLPFIH